MECQTKNIGGTTMTKDYCEKCGVKLTEANRSKSYRNRCKQCVAAYEKMRRKERLCSESKRSEIKKELEEFVKQKAEKYGLTTAQFKSLLKQRS